MKWILILVTLVFSSFADAAWTKTGVTYPHHSSSSCQNAAQWELDKYNPPAVIVSANVNANGYCTIWIGHWTGDTCPDGSVPDYPINECVTCSEFEELDPETNTCKPVNQCESVAGLETDVGWFSSIYGQTVGSAWCSTRGGGCVSYYKAGTSFCSNTIDDGSYDCVATFTLTSKQCNVPEGDFPSWCIDDDCTTFKSPVDQPITPEHKPGDPTTDVAQPNNPDSPLSGSSTPADTDSLQVEQPAPQDGDGDVIESVLNMNSDMNTLLTGLNEDLNVDNAKQNDQLTMLNEKLFDLHTANINIYENQKALTQQLNSDLVTATNKNTNQLGAKLDGIKSAIENSGGGGGVGTDPSVVAAVGSIDGKLDGILDGPSDGGSSAGQGTCIDTQTCEGFYESEYPDGIKPLLDKHMTSLKNSVVDSFVSSLTTINVSGGVKPSFTMTVFEFGEFTLFDGFDFDWIMSFIRAAMMFGTAVLCRKIVLGG